MFGRAHTWCDLVQIPDRAGVPQHGVAAGGTDAAVVLPSPPEDRKWPSRACRVQAGIIVPPAKIHRRIWALCSPLISSGAEALREELRAFLGSGIEGGCWPALK